MSSKDRTKEKTPTLANSNSGDVLTTFRLFDRNGDGTIDREELEMVLKLLDPKMWTDANVEKLLQGADANCDGVVQYEEFIGWMFGGADGSQSMRQAVQELESPTSAWGAAYKDALASSVKPAKPKRCLRVIDEDGEELCSVNIDTKADVWALKERIQETIGVSEFSQQLLVAGEELEDRSKIKKAIPKGTSDVTLVKS